MASSDSHRFHGHFHSEAVIWLVLCRDLKVDSVDNDGVVAVVLPSFLFWGGNALQFLTMASQFANLFLRTIVSTRLFLYTWSYSYLSTKRVSEMSSAFSCWSKFRPLRHCYVHPRSAIRNCTENSLGHRHGAPPSRFVFGIALLEVLTRCHSCLCWRIVDSIFLTQCQWWSSFNSWRHCTSARLGSLSFRKKQTDSRRSVAPENEISLYRRRIFEFVDLFILFILVLFIFALRYRLLCAWTFFLKMWIWKSVVIFSSGFSRVGSCQDLQCRRWTNHLTMLLPLAVRSPCRCRPTVSFRPDVFWLHLLMFLTCTIFVPRNILEP